MTRDSKTFNAYLHSAGSRQSGTLSLSDVQLSFKNQDKSLSLPLNGLKLSLGGTADRFVFLKHDLQPDVTLATADKKILFHLQQADVSGAARLNGDSRRGLMVVSFVILGLAVLAGLTVAFLWSNKDRIAEKLVSQIPISWEEKLGELLEKNTPFVGPLLNSPQIQTELDKLTTPLVQTIQSPHPKLKFAVIESKDVNAFALPGGLIFINSALILEAKSSGEVQGVIAHEIGHIVHRHHLRQIVETLGLYLLVDATLGNFEGLVAAVIENSTYLMSLKFSREHESESDDFGFDLLVRAGISPKGMIDFFAKPPQKNDSGTGLSDHLEEKLSFFATHPASKQRSERLRAKFLSLEQNFPENPLDIDVFKSKISAVQK